MALIISGDSSINFYPRPPRGGRPRFQRRRMGRKKISIHALREEGDNRSRSALYIPWSFLSTPSVRRATGHHAGIEHHVDISIHALREEGDGEHVFTDEEPLISIHALREEGDNIGVSFRHNDVSISIHALREEGDSMTQPGGRSLWNFYPRPPRGGRQIGSTDICQHCGISIHALREEGDIL